MIQRSAIFKTICAGVALLAFVLVSVQTEAVRVDALQISPVNLGDVADGSYQGRFVFQNQVMQVTVAMVGHKIEDIQAIKYLTGDIYMKGAQSVVSQVLKSQNLDLPRDPKEPILERAAKKALLLAIQGALTNQPLPSANEHSSFSVPSSFFLLAFFALCFSLGTQFSGYIAFRSGNLQLARITVAIEDITFLAGGACCGIGLVLSIV